MTPTLLTVSIVGLFTLLATVWYFTPKNRPSKRVNTEEKEALLMRCESDPSIIESVSLLDTFGKEIVCELKLKGGEAITVESGAKAVGAWLKLKSIKDGFELPKSLLLNE